MFLEDGAFIGQYSSQFLDDPNISNKGTDLKDTKGMYQKEIMGKDHEDTKGKDQEEIKEQNGNGGPGFRKAAQECRARGRMQAWAIIPRPECLGLDSRREDLPLFHV